MEDKVVITKNPSDLSIKYRHKHQNGSYVSDDCMLKSFKNLVLQLPEDSWKINPDKKEMNSLCKVFYCDYNPYDDYDDKYHSFIIDDYDNKVIIINNKLIKSNFKVNGFDTFSLFRYKKDNILNDFQYDKNKKTDLAQTIGTALLFPPSDISPFTGGELVFRLDEIDQEIIYTIQTSTFKEWTLITFGELLYKFNPISSGTMYVFKTRIWAKNENIKD